jgi:inner membrane protein YidH
MNNPNQPKADLRDYLAAERTLLAWVRTGLAMMGFGFVVARFGLFLQEFQAIAHHTSAHYGPSLWFGIALIAAGVMMNLFAGWHHFRLIRALDRREPAAHSSMQAVAIALLLALVGLAMAIYLITVRGTAVS